MAGDTETGADTASPSYDALLLITQSVCGALSRAGLQDCDDPGEAIDVIRERLETLEAACKRVIAAFTAHGDARGVVATLQTRQECEASLLAMNEVFATGGHR